MKASDFELELKKLDPRFSVVDNPNRPGLSNIFFEGKNYDLPVISTYEIKDDIDLGYRYKFPNGQDARFWSKPEILARIDDFLLKVKEGKFTNYHD